MSSDSDSHGVPTNGNGFSSPDRLTGLVGVWKQLANFGLVGLLSGLMMFLVYSQRQDIEAFKSDARDAHAEIGKLTGAIDKLTDNISALGREIRRERQERQAKDP